MNQLKQRIEQELTGNILPFWAERTPDPLHGGFYGAISNDLQVNESIPRSAILNTRILWTFSHAARQYPDSNYRITAQRAYRYICEHFLDAQYGGVYWAVDADGQPLETRKHAYVQAFSIYALAEYSMATGESHPLELAQTLFNLMETHIYDPIHGGYIEGRARDWVSSADMRLSKKEPVSLKSMNTLLHILEAYTNLLRAWKDDLLRKRLYDLILVFLERVIDPRSHHFRLFFDDNWNWNQHEPFSYGHDIEGSWLLTEAVEVLQNKNLIKRVQPEAVQIARATLTEALQQDGLIPRESYLPTQSPVLEWWVLAEGMVGFQNAYQLSGDASFASAAARVWKYIETNFVDHQYGDWFKELDPNKKAIATSYKVGPWQCPYHHSRACFEMIKRLS